MAHTKQTARKSAGSKFPRGLGPQSQNKTARETADAGAPRAVLATKAARKSTSGQLSKQNLASERRSVQGSLYAKD